jgi:hypothetical protein
MASVFAQGRYVGAILHRGPKGFEAIGETQADIARSYAVDATTIGRLQ